MTNHHDLFKALAPIEWDTINQDDLQTFLTDTFVEAQCLIDSIPVSTSLPSSSKGSAAGRPRSSTDPTGPQLPARAPKTSERAEQLRKEWKEVQVNPRENPLGVDVYKLSAKDKKGAWFARRSVHEGLPFEQWKLGMQAEFAESLKVQGGPGEGKIRGIGADKKVVDLTVDGCGKMEGIYSFSCGIRHDYLQFVLVYQLSAQFPGPTTPRDFVTLLLSSDSAIDPPVQQGLAKPRYYMLVSKPCIHPECAPRSGYIRGQYESVEFIREIKVEKPLRKVRSSVDLSREEQAEARKEVADRSNKEALARSARSAAMASSVSDTDNVGGRKRGKTIAFAGTETDEEEDDNNVETLVEWLMVTRSDPGGSVPRFMVEKGTPAGIAGDAEKFMKWVQSRKSEGAKKAVLGQDATEEDDTSASEPQQPEAKTGATLNLVSTASHDPITKPARVLPDEHEDEEGPRPGGFYGMIAEALGAVASRLPNPLGSAQGDTESDLSQADTIEDDTSSIQSFHSVESDGDEDSKLDVLSPDVSTTGRDGEAQSTHSSESMTGKSAAPTQQEKELRKLEEKKRKADEKMARARERALSKKDTDTQRDEAAVAKLKEKHDREIQKQEERYKRELKRLEEKRANEQRKAEERRKKQLEKETRQNLAMELEKVKAERDVALKQVEVLTEQIGELQGQNTLLVAKLGKRSSPELLDNIRRTNSFKSIKKAEE